MVGAVPHRSVVISTSSASTATQTNQSNYRRRPPPDERRRADEQQQIIERLRAETYTFAVTQRQPSPASTTTASATTSSTTSRWQLPTATNFFQELLQASSATAPAPRRLWYFDPLRNLQERVKCTARRIYAASVWENRSNEWARLQQFMTRHHLSANQIDWAISLWAESTASTTLPSSRLKYAADMAALAVRLGHVHLPITRMYQAGLRSSGALIPTQQAAPISQPQLLRLRQAAETSERPPGNRLLAALFVAWKTASRWDEVSRLVPRQFIELSEQRIIIDWSDRTKTTRANPFRNDSLTIIVDNGGIPPPILATLRGLRQEEELLPPTGSSDAFNRFAARVLGASANITAHSIKSGAVTLLFQAAARGLLQPHLIPRLAKHESQPSTSSNDAQPHVTLRYNRDKVSAAELGKTDEATRLLPW
jgi:hypothetical protein